MAKCIFILFLIMLSTTSCANYQKCNAVAYSYGGGWLYVLGHYENDQWIQWEQEIPYMVYQDRFDEIIDDFETEVIKQNIYFNAFDVNKSKYRSITTGKPHILTLGYQDKLEQEFSSGYDLPRDYLIPIWGKWDPMPNKHEIIDEWGSMRVDLDGDGTADSVTMVYMEVEYEEDVEEEFRFPCLQIIVNFSGQEYYLDEPIYIRPDKYMLFDPKINAINYATIFPIDVNGDGMLEIFIFARDANYYDLAYFYTLDYDITKAKFKLFFSPNG